jgi:hypothetical protein
MKIESLKTPSTRWNAPGEEVRHADEEAHREREREDDRARRAEALGGF